MIKSGQDITFVQTVTDATGALADADSTPLGILCVNGVLDAATVTVTNLGTGLYSVAVTMPTLAPGDCVDIVLLAIVGTIPTGSVIFRDRCDTAYVSTQFTTTQNLIINRVGEVSWPYRVLGSNGAPMSGVEVKVTSDSAGTVALVSGTTNALGWVDPAFYLPAGTAYFWSYKPGYNFPNPDTEVVA